MNTQGGANVSDDMVDRAVAARIRLYAGRSSTRSIYDLPGSLLLVHRMEARAMLEAALSKDGKVPA